MTTTSIPDVTPQINALAVQFDCDPEIISTIYKDNYITWQPYVVYKEDLLCFIVFARLYLFKLNSLLSKNEVIKTIQQYFSIILTALNDPEKMLHLNQLGLTGICDFHKADTDLKKGLAAEVFGSREVFNFLYKLAEDQQNEITSEFLSILKFLMTLPDINV